MTNHENTTDFEIIQSSGTAKSAGDDATGLAVEAFRKFAATAAVICGHGNSSIDPAALYQSLAELSLDTSDDHESRMKLQFLRLMEWLQVDYGVLLWPDMRGELHPKTDYSADDLAGADGITHTVEAVAHRVVQTDRTVCIQDPNAGSGIYSEGVAEPGNEFVCCLPVRTPENERGALYLSWSSANANQSKLYSQLAEAVATWLGVVLHYLDTTTINGDAGDFYRTVLNKFPAGVIVIDSRGNLAALNSAAMEIFDVNRGDIWLLGDSETPSQLWDILGEKEQARWQYMITTALTSYQTFIEPRYFHNTGYMEKVLTLKMVPLHRAMAGQTCLMIMIEDITERNIMEKYIILSEKHAARGEMADKIAYRLNHLLDVLSDRIDKTSDADSPVEKAEDTRRAVSDGLTGIKAYVDSLTDLARPDTEFITYDLKGLIEDVLFSLKNQARFRPIHFTLDINQDLPDIEMDVSQMQRLITILLQNGADATEERAIEEKADDNPYDREISIKLDYDTNSDLVFLDISDNSGGISDEIAEKMFDKNLDIKKGHGAESLTCMRIVKQHHGEITIQSRSGHGVSFRITLPRFQPRAGRNQPTKR
jgi:signal transduction histidine kinase